MAVFPTFFNSTSPSDPHHLDITFSLLLTLSFLSSLLLNPLVFLYHHQQHSITALLFQLLSLSDFLTNIYHPLLITYNLLKPGLDPVHRPATLPEQLLTAMLWTLTNVSGIITTLLSITRYISIKFVFYKLNKHYMLIYLCVYTLSLFTSVNLAVFKNSEPQWLSCIQGVEAEILRLQDIVNIWHVSHYLLAAVTSLLTVYELRKIRLTSLQPRPAQLKGNFLILILALINFSEPIILIYNMFNYRELDHYNNIPQVTKFIGVCFLPLFLSALNPVIIVSCSSGVRNMVIGWRRSYAGYKREKRVERVGRVQRVQRVTRL